jgi:hypothetical protein
MIFYNFHYSCSRPYDSYLALVTINNRSPLLDFFSQFYLSGTQDWRYCFQIGRLHWIEGGRDWFKPEEEGTDSYVDMVVLSRVSTRPKHAIDVMGWVARDGHQATIHFFCWL